MCVCCEPSNTIRVDRSMVLAMMLCVTHEAHGFFSFFREMCVVETVRLRATYETTRILDCPMVRH